MRQKNYHNDVIAVGSRVHIHDIESGEREVYTLARPDDADIRHNRISTFSPVGRALYGQRPGGVIEVEAPGGVFRVKIEAVEQESAARP